MTHDTRPVLILQMQRMGDIVLSFPLFLWMARTTPGRPLWVVAEPSFYEDLMHVSPPVTYIPWHAAEHLRGHTYSIIINLSHRPEAARLTQELEAPLKLGPALSQGEILRVLGRWQLYRAALTHNNRHNRFHWTELNALDCVDKGSFAATHFDPPRELADGQAVVGVFVGASQEEKRPTVAFWARLVEELARRGLGVVLFGGPADVELGRQVTAAAKAKVVDLCGKLSLRELMAAGQTLRLFITPDTGPMHVAAWSGLKVLNLSVGPVSPWETGPYPGGHYVLRAAMSCLDCWQCRFAAPRCRDRLDPAQVAYLAAKLAGPRCWPSRLRPPAGTRLYRTDRTAEGMYMLTRLGAGKATAPEMLGEFWRWSFARYFGLWDSDRQAASWASLAAAYPRLAQAFRKGLARLAQRMRAAVAKGGDPGPGFWQGAPPMLRPFGGYVHMLLQNADFSRLAWAESLRFMEVLLEACA